MATATEALEQLQQHARAVDTAVREAEQRATTAEKERDDAVAEAESLRAERDAHWKTKIEEAKKLHPGQGSLLKMFMAATRDEWTEIKAFLEEFEGHLPIGLSRVAQGADALLNGVEPNKTT